MLDGKLLKRNHAELEKERDRLKDDIKKLAVPQDHDHPHRGLGTHPADDGTDAFEDAKNLALSRNLEQMLDKVERALVGMDRGTYGKCENCGRDIDPARLKAFPAALWCKDCQTRLEARAPR